MLTIQKDPVYAFDESDNQDKHCICYEGTYKNSHRDYKFTITDFYKTKIAPTVSWENGDFPDNVVEVSKQVVETYFQLTNHETE